MADPFQISSDYVDHIARRSPMFSTAVGIPGSDDRWDDLSLDSRADNIRMLRSVRNDLGRHLDHADREQRICAMVLTRSISEQIDTFESGDHFEDVRHMAATFHRLRSIFDIMDTSSQEGWRSVVARLSTLGEPLRSYQQVLSAGVAAGRTAARRQVESMLEQIDNLAGDESSSFDGLSQRPGASDAKGLDDAVIAAKQAVARFGTYLRAEYLPHARERDAAGPDQYRRMASRFVGMEVDPHEAYQWGWEELDRLLAEADRVCEEILPGGSFDEVKTLLETDPARAAHSPEEFVTFNEERQRRALTELAGTHFEVPDPVRDVTVTIAPPGGPLSAYYVRPTEDFSRPGGIWFSIGDQTVFPLYQWVSTAYHEGFPGHHLQIGTAMANRDVISRGQRLALFYPGFSEGWALYAERLMGELGYLEKPDYVFGMLAKHLYRATRVVVDIGLHLQLRIPAGSPLYAGEPWTFDRAVEYMKRYGFRTDAQGPNEVLRYLGWPGQAISYKLGEREILRVRERAMRSADYEAKAFHSRLLEHGSLPLEMLDEVVLG